jgi:hypothetical protein
MRFTYWITPVLNSDPSSTGYNDICTGASPRVAAGRKIVVQDRCITAVGEALRKGGTDVIATKRVQARVSATQVLFPIPGVWGTSCVTIGSSNAGATSCVDPPTGVGSAAYLGAIGSNGSTRDPGVAGAFGCWADDPAGAVFPCFAGAPSACSPNCPANLYLGNKSPTDATLATYNLKLGNMGSATTPPPTGPNCTSGGGSVTYCTGNSPALPYSGNQPVPFGRYFPLPRVGDLFAKPPAPHIFKINNALVSRTPNPPAASACASTTDSSTCNDNQTLAATMASGQVNNCSGSSLDISTRVLTVGAGCTLLVPNGTYNLCNITLQSRAVVRPAAPPAGASYGSAEARFFLDNNNRTVAGANACAAAGAAGVSSIGKLVFNGSGNNSPTWMTNAAPNAASNASSCPGVFGSDPWTALAGELFVFGAGDPVNATTNYPPLVNFAFDVPGGVVMQALIESPNSTVNLVSSGICIKGGLAAGQLNVATNAGFIWDSEADTVYGSTNRTYYRTAWSQCTVVRSSWTGTPAYPPYPMDGC